MNILIVDDDATNRKLLRAQLEVEGHAVLDAADGVEALAVLECEPVDGVVSDILMPHMDGYSFCRKIRQHPKLCALPVLLYTSTYDSNTDRQLAASVGADCFIIKPAPVAVILEALHEAMQKAGEPNPSRSPQPDEVLVLRQYSEVLVRKLEERNAELLAALKESQLAHEEILGLNRDLERRVAERTRQLEEANRAKSEFLATMSHEVRTPLNGMFGMLELLSLGTLDSEQHATLEIVRDSSRSLQRIVDDILDFSKMEAGKLEIRPAITSIRKVIEDVRSTYSGSASSKGLLLKHSVDPRISPWVQVDALRLRQILNNFVSNALKFTTKGFIEIRAEWLAREGATDQVRFCVQDTGLGISVENQRRLFKPFSQGESDAARQAGGTGLGLTICRRLAEMMGGSVGMESELGQGTTMTLILSLPIEAHQEQPKTDADRARDQLTTAGTNTTRRTAPGVAQAEAEGTLVLVVDDHPTNRALLARQVQTLGYQAERAEDGVEALDKWKSGRFGIVLTDCQMPRMDGYQLARAIRQAEADGPGARVPIIACTANALIDGDRCLAAGMDDFLVKPVALQALSACMDRWRPLPAAPAPA